MKKFVLVISILILFGATIVFFFVQRTTATKEVAEEYTFELLRRGNIRNLVSSTGTLEAVGTVGLSSQIAGTVDNVYADYNDKVQKGQVLAVVDKTKLKVSIRDAKATLARGNAELKQAQTEYDRYKKLFEEGLISEINFLEKQTGVETAAATVESARAVLDTAQTNLKYAEIRSPITGTVIERSVEVGQTIIADSEATLFIIAEDLSNMHIEALVDETDIGQIQTGMAREDGMTVRFTVQAYPDEEFTGTVRQVRLNPTEEQNVVNYVVIVDAQNETGILLPGMTATVDFIVEERLGVLLAPNTALNFQPSRKMPQGAQGQSQAQRPTTPMNMPQPPMQESRHQPQAAQSPLPQNSMPQQASDSSNDQFPSSDRPQMPPNSNEKPWPPPSGDFAQRFPRGALEEEPRKGFTANTSPLPFSEEDLKQVYYLDETGNMAVAQFLAGSTDGINTEITMSAQLTEGMRVITGVEKQANASEKTGFLSSLRLPGLGGGSPGGAPGGGPPAGGGPPPGGGF